MLKSKKGFTLVELIVVIAILAILAGVAIPVYNGYIKKAQTAADQQLLDSISTAFAAACLTNGYDHVNAAGTTLAVKDGKIASGDAANGYSYGFTIKYEGGIEDSDAAEIVADFAMFFADNESAAFKGEEYAAGLIVDAEGLFVVVGSQVFKDKNGKEYNVSDKDRETLLNTIWANSDVVTVEDLLGNVNSVVDFAADKIGTNELLGNLVEHDEFKDIFKSMYPDLTLDPANPNAYSTEMMSALVVYTAKHANEISVDEMIGAIKTNNGTYGYITGVESGVEDDTKDAGMIAMQYAVGMAWAKENGKDYSTPRDLFDLMGPQDGEDEDGNPVYGQKSEFIEWLETAEGEAAAKDALVGYQAAMNIIGTNADKIDGADVSGADGFASDNLIYLIQGILGQN